MISVALDAESQIGRSSYSGYWTKNLEAKDSPRTAIGKDRNRPCRASIGIQSRSNHLRDLMLYKLTLEAQRRIADSPLSKREIIRRLGTSATQLYRLLDQTNYKKSLDQLVSLLQLLECEVDLVVRAKSA